MPGTRPPTITAAASVLVVSDRPIGRHRWRRRLARAGFGRVRSVDPWGAEGALAAEEYDVVVWAAARLEALARRVMGDRPPGALPPRFVLALDDAPRPARVAAALGAGFDDVLAGDVRGVEAVARVRAAAGRARRLAEAVESAGGFRGLADGSRDVLARLAPDGTILFASAACAELLGWSPSELIGRNALDLCHPDEREAGERLREGDLDAPGGGRPVVHRLRRRDGGWAWVETTARTLRDGAGRVAEVRTDSRDVGERVRMEAERTALLRVTAAVARGEDLASLLTLVAAEAARLVGVETGAVVRLHGDEGVVAAAVGPRMRAGDAVALVPRPGGAVAVPVEVDGRQWGMLLARTWPARELGAADEDLLRRFAALAGLAIANTQARARLVELARTDPLTGLANRRAFDERLAAELARARRDGSPVSLALIDLDRFKRVNDLHGHAVGDAVLREVAGRLRDVARGTDLVARLGGEELAWLLPGTGLGAAMEAAERLGARIRGAPFGRAGRQTASIGVAEAVPGDLPGDLLRRADGALYRAKDGGRDACVAAPVG